MLSFALGWSGQALWVAPEMPISSQRGSAHPQDTRIMPIEENYWIPLSFFLLFFFFLFFFFFFKFLFSFQSLAQVKVSRSCSCPWYSGCHNALLLDLPEAIFQQLVYFLKNAHAQTLPLTFLNWVDIGYRYPNCFKDLMLPQLWHRSQMWLRFSSWPGNFHKTQVRRKKEKNFFKFK